LANFEIEIWKQESVLRGTGKVSPSRVRADDEKLVWCGGLGAIARAGKIITSFYSH